MAWTSISSGVKGTIRGAAITIRVISTMNTKPLRAPGFCMNMRMFWAASDGFSGKISCAVSEGVLACTLIGVTRATVNRG